MTTTTFMSYNGGKAGRDNVFMRQLTHPFCQHTNMVMVIVVVVVIVLVLLVVGSGFVNKETKKKDLTNDGNSHMFISLPCHLPCEPQFSVRINQVN